MHFEDHSKGLLIIYGYLTAWTINVILDFRVIYALSFRFRYYLFVYVLAELKKHIKFVQLCNNIWNWMNHRKVLLNSPFVNCLRAQMIFAFFVSNDMIQAKCIPASVTIASFDLFIPITQIYSIFFIHLNFCNFMNILFQRYRRSTDKFYSKVFCGLFLT